VRAVLTFLILLVAVPFARAQQPTDQKGPFTIDLSIVTDSLHKEMFRRNGGFLVYAKIANVSGENQTITVWTQPGWSWVSDNPVIDPDISALKNVPKTRVLQPGEVYGEDVWLYFYPRTQKSVTFRLGFFPRARLPISGRPDAIPRDQIFWSNAVTLMP
jgi:hypothetical protein